MTTPNPELKDKNYIAVSKGQDSTDPTKVLPILISPAGKLLCET